MTKPLGTLHLRYPRSGPRVNCAVTQNYGLFLRASWFLQESFSKFLAFNPKPMTRFRNARGEITSCALRLERNQSRNQQQPSPRAAKKHHVARRPRLLVPLRRNSPPAETVPPSAATARAPKVHAPRTGNAARSVPPSPPTSKAPASRPLENRLGSRQTSQLARPPANAPPSDGQPKKSFGRLSPGQPKRKPRDRQCGPQRVRSLCVPQRAPDVQSGVSRGRILTAPG